jgi:hypothetical protein
LNFSWSSLSLVVDNQGISRRSLRPRLFSSLSSISVFIDILSTFFVVFVFAEQEEVVEEEVVKEEEDNESRIVGARSARERRNERIEVSTSTALFLFFLQSLTRILTRARDETNDKSKREDKKLTEINPKSIKPAHNFLSHVIIERFSRVTAPHKKTCEKKKRKMADFGFVLPDRLKSILDHHQQHQRKSESFEHRLEKAKLKRQVRRIHVPEIFFVLVRAHTLSTRKRTECFKEH